jgi:signal transduction histidine kinase
LIFDGPGELRALCRRFDWAATPLGSVELWSPTLRTAAQMVLGSVFPSLALWGPELLQLYNDAYAELIPDKHLRELGQPTREGWPELCRTDARIQERVFGGETVTLRDVRYPLKRSGNPEHLFLRISYSPIRDESGVVAGMLVSMIDSTDQARLGELYSERTRLHRELDVERARREHAEREALKRDDVLAMVSHDLRNPLAVIAMAASALLNDLLSPSTSESTMRVLTVIQRSAESLGRQIDDLLDIASIEAGHLALEPRTESAGDLVSMAAELSDAAARECRLELTTDIAPDLPLVQADGQRVIQALGNLVGNALKFTPSGGRITMFAAAEARSVRFSVQDSGVGIAPADLPHVFDRFWQRRHDSERRGTGLGLAIVRGIVEGHGGRFNVESTLGQGSVFSFTLPTTI